MMESLIMGLVMALTVVGPTMVILGLLLLPVVVLFIILCSCKAVSWRVGKIVFIIAGGIFLLPPVVGATLITLFVLFGNG